MNSKTTRTLAWTGVGLAAVWFLYTVRSILPPFIIGLLVAVLLDPVIRRLRARGLSRALSVNLVFLAFFGSVTLALVWAIPVITGQIAGFSGILQEVTVQMAEADTKRNVYVRWNPVVLAEPPDARTQIDRLIEANAGLLERAGLPTTRRGLVERFVEPYRANLAQVIQGFFGSIVTLLGTLASTAIILVFAPLLAWLIMTDFDRMRVRSAVWIPSSIRRQTLDLMRDIGGVLVGYVRGVMIAIGTYTIAMAIGLTAVQAPYSLLMAILGGVLYMVPFVGAWISMITLLIVTGLSGRTGAWFFDTPSPWAFALVCVGAYLVIDTLFNQFVFPRLVGKSVGLNPVVSMFVIFSGGAAFGLAGMVLAFPVAGAVKVMLERLQRATNAGSEVVELPAVPLRHRRIG